MSDFRIQVDTLVSSDGTGPVTAASGLNPNGASLEVQGNVLAGVATVGVTTSNNFFVGIVTSNNLSGNGSQLTGLPTFTTSKIIAYKYILSDPPLRS